MNNTFAKLSIAILLGYCGQTLAAPTLSAQTFSIDENIASDTVISQLIADNGAATSTRLDGVFTPSVTFNFIQRAML